MSSVTFAVKGPYFDYAHRLRHRVLEDVGLGLAGERLLYTLNIRTQIARRRHSGAP